MQIETTMRCDLTPIRMAIIKNLQTIAGEDVEIREHSYPVGGNINWQSHYGEQCGDSLISIQHIFINPTFLQVLV